DEHVRRRVDGWQVVAVDVPKEADVRPGERAQLGLLRARPGEDDVRVQAPDGAEQDIEALLRREAPDREDHGPPAGLTRGRPPEDRRVDRVRGDCDPRRVDPEAT